MLAKINRLYQPWRREIDPRRPISPMAFYSLATLAMFSGHRPRIMGAMIRRVRLDRPLLLGATLATLAETSPAIARGAWRIANALRNAFERNAGSREPIYEWAPSPSLTHTASRPGTMPERTAIPDVNPGG